MKKEYILKKNEDFQNIIKNNKPIKYKEYILYICKTTEDKYFFGFSVGKKIGKAFLRNKLKRQLKNIVSKNDYQKGFICIIIVNRSILDKSFLEKENDLLHIFKEKNLIKEK